MSFIWNWPDAPDEGRTTLDDYHWICPKRFKDSENFFQYTLLTNQIRKVMLNSVLSRLRKKSGFVIARSEATKQSWVSDEKNEIASLPSVARSDIYLVFSRPGRTNRRKHCENWRKPPP
jgi:hypothetical protein